ncbi:conjugal transfer protein TrbL family protein [Staphylococcus epidermidis]|uniref:conjugal transfer protein TrbL family protein n=1 Tax=Staphylococcus epidermidis TaxID=1282 RepID=UPI0034D48ADC
MRINKMITLSLIFIVLLAPLGNIALAKDDQGIGVKNELTTSNKETMDSLPTDSELEQQVKGNKADIVTAGKSKKIPKGKGGIWKAYKDEIKDEMEVRKKNGMPSSMQKFAEEFDTTTGKLKVGKFDVNGHINNVFLSIGTTLVKTSTEPLKHFTIKPADVLEAPSAKPMMLAFSTLTDTLLVLFLVFQLTKIMLAKAVDIGYSGSAIYDKVLKTFVAGTLIGLYEPIFKAIMNIQYLLVSPILNAIEIKDNTAAIIAFKGMMIDSTAPMICLPLVAILLIVVTLSLFYSLAMFIILYIMGPVAITTMVNDEMNFFSLWIRRLVSRILTLLLQSLCIAMCFASLFHITFKYGETITDLMLGMAFLFVALSVPKMLENFGDSSGAGRSTLLFVRSMGRRR